MLTTKKLNGILMERIAVSNKQNKINGWVAKRLNAADCKSAP